MADGTILLRKDGRICLYQCLSSDLTEIHICKEYKVHVSIEKKRREMNLIVD
jgi:hypothetical protein